MSNSSDNPSFTPISPNPYIVGNPIRDPSMFFGREAEFDLVKKRFLGKTGGGILVFCGERRSGKTSILFQIQEGRLGPGFVPVLIDMQSMATKDETDFLQRVSREILKAMSTAHTAISSPEFRPDRDAAAVFGDFIEHVLEVNKYKKLILLFDEYELLENKIESGSLSESILYILSSLMETKGVFLIFTGSQPLEMRQREYWKILGKSIYRTISFLQRTDALQLIQKPVAGRVEYEEGAAELILRLTAGQPFYTQAICQQLVDHLNDTRTNRATKQAVLEVIDYIIENPFPQMIFSWDGLEPEEKLTLALLGEALTVEADHAEAKALPHLIESAGYPLNMDAALFHSYLEKLFQADVLIKSQDETPRYAFRMDLWRRWVRRMHSVWQVMREIGMEVPRTSGKVRQRTVLRIAGLAAAGAALAIAVWVGYTNLVGSGGAGEGRAPAGQVALTIDVQPAEALIYRNEQQVARGSYQGLLDVGESHSFRASATGYADTTWSVDAPQESEPLAFDIKLRPLLGGLRVETVPPGAEISINGQTEGKSPLVLNNLRVADEYVVSASLPNFDPRQETITLLPDTTSRILITLAGVRVDLGVSTSPPGAEVLLDGARAGVSPLTLSDLPVGEHDLVARLRGFMEAESTISLRESSGPVHFTLIPEPPGTLVIQGDAPAKIYIDGELEVENVQFWRARGLSAGIHRVLVTLVSGAEIRDSVTIHPREIVTYDYSAKSVVNRSLEED
jgi:hypothetical protein